MEKVIIKLAKVNNSSEESIPFYATAGSAGVDLTADIDKDIIIKPGARDLVPTGIMIALPQELEAQIRPRSGLAMKFGITVLNAPGTIDSDYRGEIKVLLINLGEDDFLIQKGMRIAQMVISSYKAVSFEKVTKLCSTARDAGGFGSTGEYKVKK